MSCTGSSPGSPRSSRSLSSEVQHYLKEVGEQVESAQLALKLKPFKKGKKRQSQSESKKVKGEASAVVAVCNWPVLHIEIFKSSLLHNSDDFTVGQCCTALSALGRLRNTRWQSSQSSFTFASVRYCY